jgi:hypothetical protein
MQKRAKISPSKSSALTRPVIVPSASCARRSSSAKNSHCLSCFAAAFQMTARRGQRSQVAFARQEHRFAARVPARGLEQGFTQIIKACTGLGGNMYRIAVPAGLFVLDQIDLVDHGDAACR